MDISNKFLGLKRAVFVGDRGMTAQARVREDLEPNGLDWIFALRAPATRALGANGALQPSLFDERARKRRCCSTTRTARSGSRPSPRLSARRGPCGC